MAKDIKEKRGVDRKGEKPAWGWEKMFPGKFLKRGSSWVCVGEESALMRNFRKFCRMMPCGTPSSLPEGTFSIVTLLSTAFWRQVCVSFGCAEKGFRVEERWLPFIQFTNYLHRAWGFPQRPRGTGAVVLVVTGDVKGREWGATFTSASFTSISTTSNSVLHIVLLCMIFTGKKSDKSSLKRG